MRALRFVPDGRLTLALSVRVHTFSIAELHVLVSPTLNRREIPLRFPKPVELTEGHRPYPGVERQDEHDEILQETPRGPSNTVELDETLFCPRKYNRGRHYGRGQWVLSGTCRETGESFVELFMNREKEDDWSKAVLLSVATRQSESRKTRKLRGEQDSGSQKWGHLQEAVNTTNHQSLPPLASFCRRAGLLFVPRAVWTSTTRTIPSGPGYVFVIGPSGHCPRGVSRSIITTTSLILKEHADLFSRGPRINVGTYSCIHFRQNQSRTACARRHCFLEFISCGVIRSNGMLLCGRPRRKWFGVKASPSSGSSLTRVSGLLFSTFSVSTTTVCSTSSVIRCPCSVVCIANFAERIRRSHAPPKCGAAETTDTHPSANNGSPGTRMSDHRSIGFFQ
ncbi:hypothetical protein M513_12918 [Trichuris suis]|uniref:Uncharacterized protein n=1 Tax=Trichuris suis TaxID=68888 RepID=A0A085LMM2_9BILA|nr:hypothetical protein M513_12918 [Trichuris suis]